MSFSKKFLSLVFVSAMLFSLSPAVAQTVSADEIKAAALEILPEQGAMVKGSE